MAAAQASERASERWRLARQVVNCGMKGIVEVFCDGCRILTGAEYAASTVSIVRKVRKVEPRVNV